MNSLRYGLAAAALGLIAVWAGENMFRVAPAPGLTASDLLITWVAYSLCTASALSAAFLTGVRGLRAAFLGGALMGWLAEGVIAGTLYQGFPFQIVWTGLAWHALIGGGVVFGLGRAAVHWRLSRQIAASVLLGLFGGLWAQFWPLERNDLPGSGVELLYLVLMGAMVPLAQILLDRLTPLRRPPVLVLALAPGALAALWVAQSMAAPSPLRLVLPALLGLTFWVMKRLGGGRVDRLDLGQPAPRPWRHFVFLLAPLLIAGLASLGWAESGGHATNVAVALSSSATATLAYLGLLWRAIRRKSARA